MLAIESSKLDWLNSFGLYDIYSIFAGNRDEFLGRSTQPAHVWPTYLGSNNDNGTDNEHSPFAAKVIGGTDLDKEASAHNGTWLGITTDGRLAALTNFRETKFDGRLSRGILVRDFLLGTKTTAHNYLDHLKTTADEYGGFSLICFDLSKPTDMAYFSNRDTDDRVQPLAAGKVYGKPTKKREGKGLLTCFLTLI